MLKHEGEKRRKKNYLWGNQQQNNNNQKTLNCENRIRMMKSKMNMCDYIFSAIKHTKSQMAALP